MGLHNCETLGPTYFCRNTQGSFRCDRRKCAKGEALNEASGMCQPGINISHENRIFSRIDLKISKLFRIYKKKSEDRLL